MSGKAYVLQPQDESEYELERNLKIVVVSNSFYLYDALMNEIQKAASLMGRLNKGIKKTLTAKERNRRCLAMREAQKKRWSEKAK